MTTDRADIPWGRDWSSATYRGFAGAPPPAAPAPVGAPARGPRALRTPRAMTIGGGVLAALALGLGLGFLSKPKLGASHAAAPMHAVAPSAGALDVQVNAPIAPQPVKPAGKLEVLAPEMARNASRAVPVVTTLPSPSAAPPIASQAAPPLITPPPQPISRRLPDIAPPAPIAPPQLASSQRYAVQGAGAGDPACAGARGRAAQMICADPDLAAADRDLNRAYRRAMRASGSPDQLRDEQRDWLAIREDAARRSPRAVANVYEQRIEELNQLADDDGPRD